MRSFASAALVCLAFSSTASAQTGAPPASADRGYAEAVIQAAFGNVTSQSYGAEFGVTIRPTLQIFGEVGMVRDAATSDTSAAAQLIAGALSQTQSSVGYHVKQPVTFGVAGLKMLVPVSGDVRPYVLAGGGIASVSQDVTFSVGGSDVTSVLATQYGVTLGTDLSGSFTKPIVVAGAGAMWTRWAPLVIDAQFRYGRILGDDAGINITRAGIGIGIRF